MTTPVYYEDRVVGSLHPIDAGQIGFRYDPRWMEAAGSFPLSTTMPISRLEHRADVVMPWLANLLPEEAQLATLVAHLGVAKGDILSILKEIGGDTAGALSFGEPSDPSKWNWEPLTSFYKVSNQDEALQRHFADLRQRPFLIGEEGVRLSLAGGQAKTALTVLGPDGRPKLGLPQEGDVLAIPRNNAPSTVIIKPDNSRLEGIVENEAFCLRLASLIGIPTASVGVLKAGTRNALIVARYDRTQVSDGGIRRLHQEDLAQALSVYPEQKYERGTWPGPSLSDILTVGRGGKRNMLDGRARMGLVTQLVFNILVANTDAHAKNYSILLNGIRPSLSPLYDVSTVLCWPHVAQYYAQNIDGRKRKPVNIALRHWERIAEASALSPAGVKLRVEEIVTAILRQAPMVIREFAGTPGVNQAVMMGFCDAICTNVERIRGRMRQDIAKRAEGESEARPEDDE